jgi:DNA-binding HxlR family transcriptional regulator
MSTPKPGTRVRGSRTGRPIMALFDLLGRRWTLRLLWELRNGPESFRALQGRCDGMSPSVLNQRLGELRDAGVVGRVADKGYGLTEEGRRLLRAMAPLYRWAGRWGARAG